MTITVRLFAMLREHAGWRERALEVPAAASVGDAWRLVAGAAPALAPYRDVVRFARNGRYAALDDELHDGDQLALIPPVAGGAARIELLAAPLTDDLLAELRRSLPTAADGALVIFVGQTRETPGTPAPGEEAEAARFQGQPVSALDYEAFDEMALAVLHDIAAEIEARFGVTRLAIVHRTGRVGLGEASVVIGAAAAHRSAAFDAARYAIEELKARAPIWKREEFADGSVWVGAAAHGRAVLAGGGLIMVRVYLSVDMEGVAGISHMAPTGRSDAGYAAAAELMLGEANAAIEGAFAGGATELTLNDSHGSMYNLPPERLDPRARSVSGTKPYSMVEAARDGAFEVALFVGYHARAGHPRGVIGHTYSMRLVRVEVNGRPATEAALNGLYLGALGVPVGMVSGDDALAEELADWLPWAELVVVKRAVGFQSADALHPSRARALIRDAARVAVEKAAMARSPLRPLTLDPPLLLRLEFSNSGQADMAAVVPGFERIDDRSVTYQAEDAVTLFRAFLSAARSSRAADD